MDQDYRGKSGLQVIPSQMSLSSVGSLGADSNLHLPSRACHAKCMATMFFSTSHGSPWSDPLQKCSIDPLFSRLFWLGHTIVHSPSFRDLGLKEELWFGLSSTIFVRRSLPVDPSKVSWFYHLIVAVYLLASLNVFLQLHIIVRNNFYFTHISTFQSPIIPHIPRSMSSSGGSAADACLVLHLPWFHRQVPGGVSQGFDLSDPQPQLRVMPDPDGDVTWCN